MSLSESSRQVFIIRIWREPREIDGALPEWRGAIECTYDNQQHYLKSLDEIVAFILPYLEKLGVKLERDNDLRQWLEQKNFVVVEQD